MKGYFQIFSNGLYNVKTDNLIYRNYRGMNTSHLHLLWVNVEGSNHVQSPYTLPHRPGNQCYHLLWWTICWCYYRWWFRMCCLINELHIGPRNPALTWRSKSSRLGMVTNINYVYFYVKLIQCNPVYRFHQSIKYWDIFDSCRIT